MSKKIDCKYHFTYKILCGGSNKFYVGRHSTNNINDGYLGSGYWIFRIKDKSRLTRVIMDYYETWEQLVIAEQELLDMWCDTDGCMNIYKSACGAASGEKNHNYGKIPSEETRKKIGYANSIENCTAETRRKKSLAKTGSNHPLYGKTGNLCFKYGLKLSDETKRKIGDKLRGTSRIFSDKHCNNISKEKTGIKNPSAILNELQVLEIRKMWSTKKYKQKEIAKLFSITRENVSAIVLRKSWKHI